MMARADNKNEDKECVKRMKEENSRNGGVSVVNEVMEDVEITNGETLMII